MKKINRLIIVSLVILAVILLAGCDPSKKWEREESQLIQDYIKTLVDTVPVLKPSGLYIIYMQDGTGRIPVEKDTVSIWLNVTFLDGRLFTSNLEDAIPFDFIVGYAPVAGLDEGVRYMKQGGKAKFLTPSNLAYGINGVYPYIAGYTPLLWEIELDSVKAGTKK